MPARLTRTICPGLNIFLRGLLGRHSAAGREDLQAVRRARRRRRWPDRSPQSMIPPCRSLGTHPSEVCMDLRTVRRRSRQPESVVPGVWLGWLAFLLLAVVSLLAVPGCSRARSAPDAGLQERSEERRVGKECRSRWSPDHYKKKQMLGKNVDPDRVLVGIGEQLDLRDDLVGER